MGDDSGQANRLEEWKAHYQSWREYRTQYVQALALFSVAVVTGTFFAHDARTSVLGRLSLLAFLAGLSFVAILVHGWLMGTMKSLEDRIEAIGTGLGFPAVDGTGFVRRVLSTMRIGAWVVLALQVAGLVCLWQGWGEPPAGSVPGAPLGK